MTALNPLRHRAFRMLAAGRTAEYLGTGIAPAALAFAVLDLTGSASDLGLVVGARSMATIVLLLWGGVLADRLPRRVLLQGATTLGALVQAALATTVLLHVASIPLLAGLSVINGAATAASMPAAAALTPQTVPGELIRSANALCRIGRNIGLIAGASAGGLVAALAGPGWAIAASAAAFLVAAACFRGVRTVGDAPREAGAGMVTQLREGWREFVARPWVWLVVVQFMVVNAALAGGLQVLGPTVADATIGRTGWGIVLAAHTLGAAAGGVLAVRWQPRRALLVGVALTAAEAVPLSLLALAPVTVVLACAMFLAGVAIEQFGVAWDVALQQNIPADRLARVCSYDAVGSFVAMPIGQVLTGPAAMAFGTGGTLLGAAGLVVAATAITVVFVRSRGPEPGEEDVEGPLTQVVVPPGGALADR